MEKNLGGLKKTLGTCLFPSFESDLGNRKRKREAVAEAFLPESPRGLQRAVAEQEKALELTASG